MISYCCKRILTAVPVLLGISLLAFILGVLSPGDPAEFVLNQDGLYAPSEEQLEAMREELGLNKPLWLRYGLWLMGILQGDLGSSYITGRDIAAEIVQRLPVTLELAVLALLMAGVGGIFLGSICAVYRGSFFDNFVKNLTNVMRTAALASHQRYGQPEIFPAAGFRSGFCHHGHCLPLYARRTADRIWPSVFSGRQSTWHQ